MNGLVLSYIVWFVDQVIESDAVIVGVMSGQLFPEAGGNVAINGSVPQAMFFTVEDISDVFIGTLSTGSGMEIQYYIHVVGIGPSQDAVCQSETFCVCIGEQCVAIVP